MGYVNSPGISIFRAVLRRALPPNRIARLALLVCLFCALAGPFVFVPWGVMEYREDLKGNIDRLRPFMTDESSGYLIVRDGLAVAGGEPFRLVLRFA